MTESPVHPSSTGKQSDSSLQESPSKPNYKRGVFLAAICTAIISVLGLALGLGLGLGLKHQKNTTTSTASNLRTVPRSQLVDPSQFVLSPSFNINAPPQQREYNWTLSEIISDPAGISKTMLVVNGISPGPTIEANLGDNIVIHVTNNMTNASSIHWHGQNQNGTNFMDGTAGITECGIAPGSTFTYNWTVQNYGTFWWHAHYHTQYTDGIYGALILHSPNDTLKFANSSNSSSNANSTYDADLIFFVGDVYNLPGPVVLAYYQSPDGPPGGSQGDEPVGDAGLVNGIGQSNCAFAPRGSTCDGGSNYNLTVDPGKRYRMRMINAGNLANVRFAVDGHALTVVEADATAIRPTVVQSVTVSVAQRYSVIIETNQQAGAYYVHGEILQDMFAYTNPGLVTSQNAIMRYSSAANTSMPSSTPPSLNNITQDLDITSLAPLIPITPPAATKTETLFVNFEFTAQNNYLAFFNGTSWSAETDGNATVFKAAAAALNGASLNTDSQLIITNNDIEVFDVIINNQDEGDHPFHLHGHTPYLLGIGDGGYIPGQANLTLQNPMRRDVITIPAYSWGVLRFVTDNPGVWALHCHITWHMESGLLMQFSNLPSKIGQLKFPQSMRDQCNAIASRQS